MRPKREHATDNQQTYMITTSTWGRRALFQKERWAALLIDTLYHYRGAAYLLHEFVVMPDHIHVLLTPLVSLEKAAQFIKGGFSYRAKKGLGSNMEVWQKGFQDHRIRDAADYDAHVTYIWQNPVRKHLCQRPEEYPYSSARSEFERDPVPQGLKPQVVRAAVGAAEAAPFQNSGESTPQSKAPEATKPTFDNKNKIA
jgi:putative transposase